MCRRAVNGLGGSRRLGLLLVEAGDQLDRNYIMGSERWWWSGLERGHWRQKWRDSGGRMDCDTQNEIYGS